MPTVGVNGRFKVSEGSIQCGLKKVRFCVGQQHHDLSWPSENPEVLRRLLSILCAGYAILQIPL